MTKLDLLLGLQWGDEGKGKVVDVLTPEYDIVCRFQGGPNAGHTIKFDGKKFVLHTIPSGIFNDKCINVIGNGAIVDAKIFKDEVDGLTAAGVDVVSRLLISSRTHLIVPTHRALDAANEGPRQDENRLDAERHRPDIHRQDRTPRTARRRHYVTGFQEPL